MQDFKAKKEWALKSMQKLQDQMQNTEDKVQKKNL